MQSVFHLLENNHPVIALVLLGLAFAALAKGADVFVESSVALAERFRVPKIVIGLVLVSFATTAPELSVSLMAAVAGNPEMALGNAVGSVICNCGLGLALCGIISLVPVPVIPRVLKTAGICLLGVCVLAFVFVMGDRTIDRLEGAVLVVAFIAYLVVLFEQHRRGRIRRSMSLDEFEGECGYPLKRLLLNFVFALGVIILASKVVVASATSVARSMGLPESVIALTLVALGTSIPEVATSITAARKGEGELSIGNILGANIMNVCWVAGASAVVNPLILGGREILFMFPAMLVMVAATLGVLRSHHELSRKEGLLLCGLYVLYLVSFALMFVC